MGNQESTQQRQTGSPTGERVLLHVYEPTPAAKAKSGQPTIPGIGIYHSGVEVWGVEYAYAGGSVTGSGVYASRTPKAAPPGGQWQFSKTVELGGATCDSIVFKNKILPKIKQRFDAKSYHVLSKNCNHFTEALCKDLGVSLPSWVNRAAKLGERFLSGNKNNNANKEEKANENKPSFTTTSKGYSLGSASSGGGGAVAAKGLGAAGAGGKARKNPWRDPNFMPSSGIKLTKREDMPAISAAMKKNG